MNTTSATETSTRDLTILVATSDLGQQRSLAATLSRLLGTDCAVRITVKAHEREVRAAASLYAFDLVLLCVDSIAYFGERDGQPQRALELVRELKERHGVALVLLSTHYPKGFTTAAEQAGVEGILPRPCAPEGLAEQVRTALAMNARVKANTAKALAAKRRRAHLRPRVVVVDGSVELRELVSSVVWSCWPNATVVVCPEAATARAELARVPADLLITDLECMADHEPPLLGWLMEQKVKYPIVILCDDLLPGGPDAAALPSLEGSGVGGELVGNLWLHFLPKRFNWAEFTEDLGGLLD